MTRQGGDKPSCLQCEVMRLATLPDLLLDAVKNYLDITWEDEVGDEKLAGIISRGMRYIDAVAGETCDYTIEDKPRELLFDYVRYVRSGALDQFMTNYLSELTSLQIAKEVARYAAEQAARDDA